MKRFGIASPQLILFIFVKAFLWSCLFIPFVCLGIISWKVYAGLVFCIVLLDSYLKRNAYRWYQISEQGVRNGKKTLGWEEIDSYSLCRVRDCLGRNIFWIQFPSVICFGVANSDRFEELDSKSCVFLPLTKKNLLFMLKLANGQNSTVEQLYYEYFNYAK